MSTNYSPVIRNQETDSLILKFVPAFCAVSAHGNIRGRLFYHGGKEIGHAY